MFRCVASMRHTAMISSKPSSSPKRLTNYATLTSRQAFLRVRDRGVRQVAADFILQADAHAEGHSTIRTGFTASKKIGNAVKRNRAKRRMRAMMQAVLPEHGMAGTDYVLIARGTIISADFQIMQADFKKALKSVHHKLLKNQSDVSRQPA